MMEILQQAWMYFLSRQPEFWGALREHLSMSGLALGFSIAVCVPLGIASARWRRGSLVILGVVNTLRVVPSLAVLFLVIPLLGLSRWSAVLALILLAMPPVLINTDAGFRSVAPSVREAARGMGMSSWQVLRRVELPLAMPLILTGVRTATVEVIASATLAAFVGSGGLGIYITRGFALYDNAILMVGAIPVALLALFFEGSLGWLQTRLQVPGSVARLG